MKGTRIVILGASGFVGTTLTERLRGLDGAEVVPVIHSAGSAWRLARVDAPISQVDIADRKALEATLHGATHVVNCTRGPNSVMLEGLHNILAACRAAGVRRLVHLSSVLVYGDPPPPESQSEDAAAVPLPGAESYGFVKLQQDRMVQQAARSGLPSVILCPPNISGPFSGYIAGIVNGIRRGTFAIVDDGAGPCNLVDVRNLCHAIERALVVEGDVVDGRRVFVTDDGEPTWQQLVEGLRTTLALPEARRIPRQAVQSYVDRTGSKARLSLWSSLRHLVSSDVRAALRKDPLLGKLDQLARHAVAALGNTVETRMRLGIEGVIRVPRPDPYADLAWGMCAQQLRGVRHRNALARSLLGYRPAYDFQRSTADFAAWYRRMHGVDGGFWDLSKHLYV